jgi:hypothetical protein
MKILFIRLQAFTATELDKIFSDNKPEKKLTRLIARDDFIENTFIITLYVHYTAHEAWMGEARNAYRSLGSEQFGGWDADEILKLKCT